MKKLILILTICLYSICGFSNVSAKGWTWMFYGNFFGSNIDFYIDTQSFVATGETSYTFLGKMEYELEEKDKNNDKIAKYVIHKYEYDYRKGVYRFAETLRFNKYWEQLGKDTANKNEWYDIRQRTIPSLIVKEAHRYYAYYSK